MSAPRVSVAVVTHGREPLLPLLLEQFDRQTYPHRELVLLDDSPAPSPSLAGLDRADVRYCHHPARLTVGRKRNEILGLLTGELICQWDDDDHYAPRYLEFAARALRDADFVKLDRWFLLRLGATAEELWYWDTRGGGPPELPPDQQARWLEQNRLGYGFSFSFRRHVLEQVRSPDTSVGDDYAFARAVVDQGFRTALLPDQEGLALHLEHGTNLSRCFPNRRLPVAFLRTLFPHFDPARYRAALAQVERAAPPG